MTYADKGKSIGKRGSIIVNHLKIDVRVLDYKRSYNKDRWLVTPIAGAGQVWVEQEPWTKEELKKGV